MLYTDDFYRLVDAAGYGNPRFLPKATEVKLRKLIRLVRAEAVTAPPQRQSVCRGLDALIRRSLSAEGDEMRTAAAECAVDRQSYYRRVEAAADQLHALATAKTDANRQAQLANIDWQLVADEFDAIVAKYDTSIKRYTSRVIRELQAVSISYSASVEMELAMADLEAHVAAFESAEVDLAVAEVWADRHDALAESRGIILALPPITSLTALRGAFEARQATHRALDCASYAYREGWPISVPDGVQPVLALAGLDMDEKARAIAADCPSGGRQGSWLTLRKTLRGRLMHVVSAPASLEPAMSLVAELAAALPTAVEKGYVVLKGASAEEWHLAEIGRGC